MAAKVLLYLMFPYPRTLKPDFVNLNQHTLMPSHKFYLFINVLHKSLDYNVQHQFCNLQYSTVYRIFKTVIRNRSPPYSLRGMFPTEFRKQRIHYLTDQISPTIVKPISQNP